MPLPACQHLAFGMTSRPFLNCGQMGLPIRHSPAMRLGLQTRPASSDKRIMSGALGTSSIGAAAIGSSAFDSAPTAPPVLSRASGFTTSAFGHPSASAHLHALAVGFSAGVVGTPATRLTFVAVSKPPTSHFGTPKAQAPSISLASGFCHTEVGMPALLQIHRVAHISPLARFGVPTLRRANSC